MPDFEGKREKAGSVNSEHGLLASSRLLKCAFLVREGRSTEYANKKGREFRGAKSSRPRERHASRSSLGILGFCFHFVEGKSLYLGYPPTMVVRLLLGSGRVSHELYYA